LDQSETKSSFHPALLKEKTHIFQAVSTRATLFEMVRDYEKAAKDLQRIVSLLTKQAEEKGNQFVASSPMGLALELKQARHRFYQMQEQASKGIPLNFYLIL